MRTLVAAALFALALSGCTSHNTAFNNCGSLGGTCCADRSCKSGGSCVQGTCQACGGPGQACRRAGVLAMKPFDQAPVEDFGASLARFRDQGFQGERIIAHLQCSVARMPASHLLNRKELVERAIRSFDGRAADGLARREVRARCRRSVL